MTLYTIQKKEKTVVASFSKLDATRISGRKQAEARRKRPLPYARYGTIFLWLVFCGSFFYVLFFSSYTMLSETQFFGSSTISDTSLESEWLDFSSGKRYLIFSQSNFFFFDQQSFEDRLRNLSPRIRSVSLSRQFPSGMQVLIEERPIVFAWQGSEKTLLLNEEGILEERAHMDSSSVYWSDFFFVRRGDGSFYHPGDSFLEEKEIRFLVSFVGEFPSRFSFSLDHQLEIPFRQSGELRVRTEDGWEMLLDMNQSPSEVFQTLELVLEKGVEGGDLKRLTLLDLRTRNKAYYTLQGSEVPLESASSLSDQ